MAEKFKHGYALIVGVGDAKLTTPERDAAALFALFTSPLQAGYDEDKIVYLPGQKATKEAILKGLDQLAASAQADPHATMIIYFSGHGVRILDTAGQILGYTLVPYGFNPAEYKHTGITGSEFTQKIQAIYSQKLVLFLDCCHAAGLPEMKGDEVLEGVPLPPDLERLELGSGQVIVASSSANQKSYAGDYYSIFTECLLEALSGMGTRLPNGYAGILDVLTYLFSEVPSRVKTFPQNPYINKITGLSENFPLCFYAGGDTYLAGVNEPAEAQDLTGGTLTPEQNDRLTLQMQSLQQEHANHLLEWKNKRAARETFAQDTLLVVQIDQRLLAEESNLANLEKRIDRIRTALAAAAPPTPLPADLAGRLDKQSLLEQQVHAALLKLNYDLQEGLFGTFLDKNQSAGAFFIQGEQYYGQSWLLNRLLLETGSADANPIVLKLGSLAISNGLNAIWVDLLHRLGLPYNPLPPPEQILPSITKRLLEKWKTQHITLVFYDPQHLGEAATCHILEQLWAPLAAGVAAAPPAAKTHRLMLFLVDNTYETRNWNLPLVQKIDDAWQPDAPVHLQKLKPIEASILDRWYNTVKTGLPATFTEQYRPGAAGTGEEIYNTWQGVPEDVLKEICERCQVDWYSKENTWIRY